MDETAVAEYITGTFAGVETASTGGYAFFFYGPDRMLPFATLATADNEFDRASNLDRPGVFRLNIAGSGGTPTGRCSAPKRRASAPRASWRPGTTSPRWTGSSPIPSTRRSRGCAC